VSEATTTTATPTPTDNQYLGWLLRAAEQLGRLIGAEALWGTFQQWPGYDLAAANESAKQVEFYMQGRVDGLPSSASIYFVPGGDRLPVQGNQPSWVGGIHLHFKVEVDNAVRDVPGLWDALATFAGRSWSIDHQKRADALVGFIRQTLYYLATWKAATTLGQQDWLKEASGQVDYSLVNGEVKDFLLAIFQIIPPLP
jgi:hypothetical protein